jgi:multiple sugar transport system ATP-binding protein
VRQNLEFPLRSKVRNLSARDIDARVARAAKTLRIEHLLERKTDRLSGGEMQRVSIGRAIVREPRVFLMDEPLSNLDAKLREILRAELKDLQMKLGATFLYVTHDQVEAMSMGDRVAVLNAGRVVQAGTPQQIYNRPRDTFVAAFVGSPSMNLLPARVADGRAVLVPGMLEQPLDSRLPSGRVGETLTLGVRSEDVRVGPGQPVEARVHGVENHGVEQIVTLRVEECLIRATVPATLPLRIDASVGFGFNPEKLHWFDPSGHSLRSDDTEEKSG